MKRYLHILFFLFFNFISLLSMELQKTGFPKWDGLIDLKNAGLRVPDGVFLRPGSSEQQITESIEIFLSKCRTNLISLRPDSFGSIAPTPPGINFNKNEKEKILGKLREWSTKGFGVAILESHNRLDYDFCCNVLLDEDGGFSIEFVGPGYDGGDLNKSILTPTMLVRNVSGSTVFYYSDSVSGLPNVESLNSLFLRIFIESRVPSEEEKDIRLNYVITKLLPDMGIRFDEQQAAIKWLQENKCDRLLQRVDPRTCVSLADLQEIVFSASLYANYMLSQGRCLNAIALTVHKYNNKIFFFGTYDWKKWGGSRVV